MKISKIIYLIPVFFIFTACDSFLDEEPKNLIDPDRFYNNEADGVAALTGIYSHLMSTELFGRHAGRFFNLTADDMAPTRDLGAARTDLAFKYDENDPLLRGIWITMYKAINDANLLIYRVRNSQIPERARKELEAEGLFLRAFMYYYMVMMFKDVPYITEPTIDDESYNTNAFMTRTPSETILSAIVEDLKIAETELPANIRPDYKMRPTRWAAKTLKLKIYSWQRNHTAVKAAAQDIIQNSFHRLLSNYGDIFRHDNEFNDEMIFQFDYVFNLVPGSNGTSYEPRAQDERIGVPVPDWFRGFGQYTVYKSIVAAHPDDLRKFHNIYEQLDNGAMLNFSYIRKMLRPLQVPEEGRNNDGQNFQFFRLADVYLELAEAENELSGPTALAYNSINVIRQRAGLDDLEGLSQAELRQAIRDERLYEFLGEGTIRKIDLMRWGILREAIEQRREAELVAPRRRPVLINILNTKLQNLQPHKIIFPIPIQEIILNNNLTQNPGYL
ncbi:MAG: RagB/SusD family nutrient uptake outer membrane protein [Cyclobacteriaceae bacterium]|nr:RagB/SusD family nutrient uptake outer membrane protein [Cyclobacteriaceae bacterium]